MYATPFNFIQDLVNARPGPGAGAEGVSESAVRQVVSRWRRAGWVEYQALLAGYPPWLWMTHKGLAAFGFTHYRAAPPAISRLHHLYAINAVRIDIEEEGDEWIAERAIRAGLYILPDTSEEHRHIPDGILHTDDGNHAIEVELTQKKPDDIYKKMYSLIHAYDAKTLRYFYSRIRYFTPDPHVQKGLEAAREKLREHNRQRAELVEIELINLD